VVPAWRTAPGPPALTLVWWGSSPQPRPGSQSPTVPAWRTAPGPSVLTRVRWRSGVQPGAPRPSTAHLPAGIGGLRRPYSSRPASTPILGQSGHLGVTAASPPRAQSSPRWSAASKRWFRAAGRLTPRPGVRRPARRARDGAAHGAGPPGAPGSPPGAPYLVVQSRHHGQPSEPRIGSAQTERAPYRQPGDRRLQKVKQVDTSGSGCSAQYSPRPTTGLTA
jgi:hypothetical protein